MAYSSKFGVDSTGLEVADFYKEYIQNKNIIITGVSPYGVGRAVCLAIATHEPRLLIITGRDENRTGVVQEELKTQWPTLNIRNVVMDLAQNESVQKAAEDINQICATERSSIDVLINNAGIMCLPERTTTEDGTELHLQVNYVGHYLLTRLLLSNLAKSPGGGRIVNVSSSAHAISPFRFSDPAFSHNKHVKEDEQPLEAACKEFETPWTLDYSPLIAYGQSKTALSLHAVAVQQAVGNGIVAISVHPGVIATELWRHMPPDLVSEVLSSVPVKTHAQGSATILMAALDPSLKNQPGAYLDDCAIAMPAEHASNLEVALKLWNWTEQKYGQYIF